MNSSYLCLVSSHSRTQYSYICTVSSCNCRFSHSVLRPLADFDDLPRVQLTKTITFFDSDYQSSPLVCACKCNASRLDYMFAKVEMRKFPFVHVLALYLYQACVRVHMHLLCAEPFLCTHFDSIFNVVDFEFDGFSTETCRSMVALMDVSLYSYLLCVRTQLVNKCL